MDYLASVYGRGTYNSMYSTVADKINFNVGSNNYIRVQSSHLLYKQLAVGTQYVINIPGFSLNLWQLNFLITITTIVSGIVDQTTLL